MVSNKNYYSKNSTSNIKKEVIQRMNNQISIYNKPSPSPSKQGEKESTNNFLPVYVKNNVLSKNDSNDIEILKTSFSKIIKKPKSYNIYKVE